MPSRRASSRMTSRRRRDSCVGVGDGVRNRQGFCFCLGEALPRVGVRLERLIGLNPPAPEPCSEPPAGKSDREG